jgi:hypothetical protein
MNACVHPIRKVVNGLKSPADIERDAFRAMLIEWATIRALIETLLQGKKFAEI